MRTSSHIAGVTVPLALLLLSLGLAAQDAGPQGSDVDVDPKVVELYEDVAIIPFTLGGGRPVPVVEAMVNGQGPFKFFYDTGASVCVLDSGFVEELGIEKLGAAKIGDHTATARIDAQQVKIDTLELQGIGFEEVPAVAFDRSSLRGDTIRGVLGLPLFRNHLLTVDYVKSHLEICKDTLPEGGKGVLPYRGDLLPIITITIDGKEHPCHIDSGSPTAFTLPKSIVDGLEHKTEPRVVGHARTVNSEFDIWSVQLDATIVLAGIEYVDPEVGYNEIIPTGLFGYQVLKDLVLSIDQRSKRVRILPAAEQQVVDASAERRKLGVALTVHGERLTVSSVSAGSAAEKAGLEAGDVLLEVDGKAVTQKALEEALAGKEAIRLKVERDGKPVEVVAFST